MMARMNRPLRLLSTAEAAERLSLSRMQTIRLARSGQLPTFAETANGRVFNPADVEALRVERQRAKATSLTAEPPDVDAAEVRTWSDVPLFEGGPK